MNIADKFLQINILLTKNRFIPVLEKVSAPAVAAVMPHRIAGQQSAHDSGHRDITGPEQKMKMIGNQYPGKASGLGLDHQLSESIDKILTILIIAEYLATLNASGNDIMHCSGRV